jgi:hypothetical protein
MDTPWQRARHRKSEKQERRNAEFQGSSRQPNSGRGRFRKRDNRMFDEFLVETRHTDAGSYTIQKQEFQDITKQAIKSSPGCLPAMQPDIDGLQLWVRRLSDFDEMFAELMSLRSK